MRRSHLPGQLLALAASAAMAQTPSVDSVSLMTQRFYEANGGMMVDRILATNVAPGTAGLSLEVQGPGGTQTIPLRADRVSEQLPFAALAPSGVPGIVKMGQPGEWTLRVKASGRDLGTLRFTLRQQNGQWVRDGAWKTAGFLTQRVDRPDAPAQFQFWTGLGEIPGKSRAMLSVHVMSGAVEIAATPSPKVVSVQEWQWFSVDMTAPRSAGGKYVTAADLTKKDGALRVVVKADGKELKAYGFTVRGGKLEGGTQRLDTSSGSSSSYHLTDIWPAR